MSPNFEYYKIFYYVARYRSFTLAAKVLLTSQPSVTRSIQSLEHALGCTLFVRARQGVSLTAEGELLYRHIARACESIFQAEEALSDTLGLQNGTVYLGATETAIHCFLLEKLEDFHNRFPHVAIKITSDSTLPVLAELKSGRVDFAVVTTPFEKENDTALKILRARPFRDILVAGPRFAELVGRELGLAELALYPLVCLSGGTMTYRFLEGFYAQYGLRLQPDIELAAADLLLPIIGKNLGVGFVPEPMAREALARGEVLPLKLRERLPGRSVCVVRDVQRPLGPAARQLLRFLRAVGDADVPDAGDVPDGVPRE